MLTACPVPGKEKSRRLCEAFVAGAPRDAKGLVFYGVTEGNVSQWRARGSQGLPWYYIDNSYFDATRGDYFRVTRNKIQHDGIGQTDGRRFAAIGAKVLPARDAGSYALAVEQSDVFMRLIAGRPAWLQTRLGLGGDLPVRVRRWNRDKPLAMTSLHTDLADAAWVVTHSSAAAVEAALAGIDVIVSKASAAYTLGRTLPSVEERTRWAGVLADNQFTVNELIDGTAWRAVNGQ